MQETIDRIKKNALENSKRHAEIECFMRGHFNVCPINSIHGHNYYKNRGILNKFHCVDLCELTHEEIEKLKLLVTEAINYKRKWWHFIYEF